VVAKPVNDYFKNLANVTIKITTPSDSPCSNQCFLKGSNIQMLAGTKTEECMCDPDIGLFYYPNK
jgi:hypothetical protein